MKGRPFFLRKRAWLTAIFVVLAAALFLFLAKEGNRHAQCSARRRASSDRHLQRSADHGGSL